MADVHGETMAKYVVEIEYTVPDLDAAEPTPPPPRGGTYVVQARNEVGARENALEEFRRPERESLLNWRRHISSIVVLRFVGDA